MKKLLVVTLLVFVLFLVVAPVSANTALDSTLPGQEPPAPGDDDALQTGILWLALGGGAGVAAYALLGKVKAFEDLSPENKRYVSLVATAALAVAAYMVASGLGYVEAPTTTQGWLEKLTSIAYASTATALLLHGSRQLGESADE